MLVPFRFGAYQQSRMDAIKGQADLLYRNGTFYLAVTLEVPTPTPDEVTDTLGIDLGIVNLATDSEGESFSGEVVEQNRKRHHALRQRLQKHGTKSAKRHLKKLSGKEARFKKDTNHVISKRIVQKAKQHHKALAIEELRHIRPVRNARLDTLSVSGIVVGLLDNCVNSSPIRPLLQVSHCTPSTPATRPAPVASAVIVQRRTAKVKLVSVVKLVVIPITLIGTPLRISLGHRSWCLLFRPVVDLDALRSARKDRNKPLASAMGFMTFDGSGCVW
jgi:hypothetical protein